MSKQFANLGFWIVNEELEQMERYLAVTNSAIQDNKKRFDEWVNAQTKDFDEEQTNEFYSFYEDEFVDVNRNIPRLLFCSFVVTWHSFLESQLAEVCRKLKLEISIKYDDNEHYGDGIRRSRAFLYNGENYLIDGDMWQDLTRISGVRNYIVHKSGVIDFSYQDDEGRIKVKVAENSYIFARIDRDLYRYMEQNDLVNFWGRLYITPSDTYCGKLITFGREFLRKIYKDVGMIRD